MTKAGTPGTPGTLFYSLILSHSLSLDMLNNPKVTLSPSISLCHSLSLTHTHTLSQSLNLSFTHSQHAEQLLFSCLCSKVTLPLSHSFNLDMLNRAPVVTNRIEKKNIYKLNFK